MFLGENIEEENHDEAHHSHLHHHEGDKKDVLFPQCRLHCLVNIQRDALCNNTHEGIESNPSLTFWSYLAVRTGLGVLTAASLMMFEGAVMATIQEMGGDYGIQRFVGEWALVFETNLFLHLLG